MTTPPASESVPSGKTPRTERGRRTLRKLLDAAAIEFGERGFHEASITGITRRAGTALGSFYTYFDSKDEIFRALVDDLSGKVREAARAAQRSDVPALEVERSALSGFLRFAREHKEIYRIIDECEFVDPESFRLHYRNTAGRIEERLADGVRRGELREGLGEAHAWAIMGMNVFLGLRYAVWSDEASPEDVAELANSILRQGIAPHRLKGRDFPRSFPPPSTAAIKEGRRGRRSPIAPRQSSSGTVAAAGWCFTASWGMLA